LFFCSQRLPSPLAAASRVYSSYSFPAFTMAYWKAAGMSYLQYVNLATTALRNTVKPSLAARYAIKEDVHYKKQAWINSKPQEKRQQTHAQPRSKFRRIETQWGHRRDTVGISRSIR
jgi:hypothetical protein